MADRLLRAQCTLRLDSLVPEDNIVNTWYFDDDDDPTQDEADTISDLESVLSGFYQGIQSIYPATVDPTIVLRVYDMRDPEPRVVMHAGEIAITPSADQPLPNEIALCLSFAATAESGVPAGRRRGRLYLGPIGESAVTVIGSHNRPLLATRDLITNEAEIVRNGVSHTGDVTKFLKWSIYSPTTDLASTVDDAFNDVVRGWCDDAWDIQRRRGAAPTARTTF